MPALRQVVRFGYVPFMLLGLNALAFYVVSAEHSYFWLAPVLLSAFLVAHAAEALLPWYEEWNHSHGDDQANLLHTLVYESSNVHAVFTIPIVVWLFPFQGYWPTQWPLAAQLVMAIVIADFAFTMMHYLSHRLPILWRLHAVHHGVTRLCGFNGLVRHPIHQSLDTIVGTAPLVILGMPVEVAVLLGLAISIQLIVQHSNVAYALGPLRNQLSIGQIHHLHHVNWGKEGDCNFGLFFTAWDRVLGTFQAEPSKPIAAHDMGIDELPNFPKSYLQQLVLPFVYKPGQGEPKRFSKPPKVQRARLSDTIRPQPAE